MKHSHRSSKETKHWTFIICFGRDEAPEEMKHSHHSSEETKHWTFMLRKRWSTRIVLRKRRSILNIYASEEMKHTQSFFGRYGAHFRNKRSKEHLCFGRDGAHSSFFRKNRSTPNKALREETKYYDDNDMMETFKLRKRRNNNNIRKWCFGGDKARTSSFI